MKPGDMVMVQADAGLRAGYKAWPYCGDAITPTRVIDRVDSSTLGMVLDVKEVAMFGNDDLIEYVKVLLPGKVLWTIGFNTSKF